MKFKTSNVTWGVCLLLVAAFVLVNQFSDFTDIGVGSIIAMVLALAFIAQCVARMDFAPLPIPLAVLYLVLQTPLGFHHIRIWPMMGASVLAYIGLELLLPKKRRRFKFQRSQVHLETDDGNNPSVSVNFGAVSRHLHAGGLETVRLDCNFGAMEIFFDNVNIGDNGAEVVLNCSFGAIKLLVPSHWQIVDKVNCSLGGLDIGKRFSAPAENAPRLTLSGTVSFGGIEVRALNEKRQGG